MAGGGLASNEGIRCRLEEARRRDEVISPVAPERLAGGAWADDLTWPSRLRAGIIEPRKGYRYRPENLAWVAILGRDGAAAERVVELGAGTGSLALIAHYLLSPERTVAVEIQPVQANRLRRTIAAHQLTDFQVLTADLRDADTLVEVHRELGGKADLVVANPPWFPVDWGRPSIRATTRASTHTQHGDVAAFLVAARELVSKDGRIYVLYDAQRIGDLMAALAEVELRLVGLDWLSDQRPGRDGVPFRVWCRLALHDGTPVQRLV